MRVPNRSLLRLDWPLRGPLASTSALSIIAMACANKYILLRQYRTKQRVILLFATLSLSASAGSFPQGPTDRFRPDAPRYAQALGTGSEQPLSFAGRGVLTKRSNCSTNVQKGAKIIHTFGKGL